MGKINKITGVLIVVGFALTYGPVLAGEGQNVQTLSKPQITSQGSAGERSEDITACSCIKTARSEGVDIPIGTNAEDLQPNSRPEIGALILLTYPNTDHVAKILAFESEGFLVYEGNFEPCEQRERLIYYIDPFIRGFWKP